MMRQNQKLPLMNKTQKKNEVVSGSLSSTTQALICPCVTISSLNCEEAPMFPFLRRNPGLKVRWGSPTRQERTAVISKAPSIKLHSFSYDPSGSGGQGSWQLKETLEMKLCLSVLSPKPHISTPLFLSQMKTLTLGPTEYKKLDKENRSHWPCGTLARETWGPSPTAALCLCCFTHSKGYKSVHIIQNRSLIYYI